MLQFVLGRAGSGKTEYLRRLLADAARAGREKLFMLVPEQYSFETEKAMLRLCGAKLGNTIRVFSFSRLAEAVFREEGGVAGRYLSDGGRRILMALAIADCADQLEVYAGAAKSGRVTDLMLTAVNEMKLCRISPEQLTETADRLLESGRTGLGKKLGEIALLYGTFEALVAQSYLDSRDDLTRLAQALETSGFFDGATVAVDSFEGFTAQELEVLRRILPRAERVTVSLCTDGLDRGSTGLFALVERTRSRLARAAKEAGVPLAPEVLLTGAPRFEQENLKLMESQLFRPEETLTGEDHEGIVLFQGADVYEEAEFTAATIRRLTGEQGWRYRDFSVICGRPEQYYGSLDVALRKRGVPCFVSAPARVDAEPVTRLVLGAFEALRAGLATEELLKLLKTGLTGFSPEEISDLENYAFLWTVERGDWRRPFTRHPQGFGQVMGDADRLQLDRLEALRQRLIRPLERFAAATADATGAQIAEAVYRLLTDFGLEETLPAACAALEAAGEPETAARQLRVWDLLMQLLDQMHSILGERKISREHFLLLLREVVEKEDVSEIPQTTDQVLFGTPEQVRQAAPKCVFILGAAQGQFPLAPASSGVFSDTERRELIALDLPLGDPLEQKAIEERYLAYSAACLPARQLYLSWPAGAGEGQEPGELILAVRRIFPTLAPLRDLPDAYYANSREAAFTRMAARFTENSPQAASLRALLGEDPAYGARTAALARAAGRRPVRMEDRELTDRLFGREPVLSPTQIETYHSCAFRYFCRFGLGVRERRPAEVDLLQYGTLMHYLFEQVFRQGSQTLAALDDAALLDWVRGLVKDYARESLGGFEQLSGRERYRLERLAASACRLIRHVAEELAQSRFVPRAFELKLGEPQGDILVPPLRIVDRDGRTVTVGGTVDRADLYTAEDGREYVRVIDYKTGHKVFRLVDVLYGLNLQMLIYLAALAESGRALPAGILYMPAAEPALTVERGADGDRARAAADKKLRMSGLVLSDEEIVRAMEAGAAGRFIPASLNKDGKFGRGSAVLDERGLQAVMEHARRLVATMSEALHRGEIAPAPTMVNQNACARCPYGPVCGREYGEKDVVQDRAGTEEVLRRMEGGEDRG